MKINIDYNFQSETDPLDADRYSSKLQEYHRLLWSKQLPNGDYFELTRINENRLYHKSKLGEFYLASDRAIATFSSWKKMEPIISKIPQDRLNRFIDTTETIGGIMIWPSNRIDGKQTINGARGLNRKICDRLDLTIECIRRYYVDLESPLYETLKRYDDFFRLFVDFRGYIDFFVLQDAVSSDYSSVNIALPFNNFESSPLPSTVEEYMEYMDATETFVKARNNRIAELRI